MRNWLIIRDGERVRSWLREHGSGVEYVVLSQRLAQGSEHRLGRLDLADASAACGGRQGLSETLGQWLRRMLKAYRGELQLRLRLYSDGGQECMRAFSLRVECPSLLPGACRVG